MKKKFYQQLGGDYNKIYQKQDAKEKPTILDQNMATKKT